MNTISGDRDQAADQPRSTRTLPAVKGVRGVLGLSLIPLAILSWVGCGGEAEGSAPYQAVAMASPADAERGSVELRRLWAGEDFNFFASSPSPDGRFVTEIDWTAGDLAVRDLTTGVLHRLTDKGSWDVSADYAEVARFTPDGSRILYGWFNDGTGLYEMRMLDFTIDEAGIPHGSGSRIVHDGTGIQVYYLYEWLSDDEILTGVYRPDNTTGLAFLSITTGSLRVLKSFDWNDAGAALSPDARYVAYDHPPGTDPTDRDIGLLSVDGSSDVPLVTGPGRDIVLGWIPSDGSLLYHSERGGSASLWRLPMADGKPTGEPVLIRESVRNLDPLGFAGDSFYFGVEVEAPVFRSATIDPATHQLVPGRTTFEAPWGGTTVRALAWSPDGEHVAHDVTMTGRPITWIFVRSADGTPVREWSFELRLQRMLLSWTPDGSLILSARDARGRAGFFRMDLRSGELDMVRRFTGESTTGRLFAASPDGHRLYFTQVVDPEAALAERTIEIVERELATGRERTIHRVAYHDVQLGAGHWSPIAPTPDGNELAFMVPSGGDHHIRMVPVAGGAEEPLYTVRAPATIQGIIGWEPDGASLLILVQTDGSPEVWSTYDVELWRVFRNGTVETLGAIADYAGGASLHPDGRTLTYRSGRYRGEIWAIDGLVEDVALASDGRAR
jgi:Tol biopolymer transport system component